MVYVQDHGRTNGQKLKIDRSLSITEATYSSFWYQKLARFSYQKLAKWVTQVRASGTSFWYHKKLYTRSRSLSNFLVSGTVPVSGTRNLSECHRYGSVYTQGRPCVKVGKNDYTQGQPCVKQKRLYTGPALCQTQG